MFKDKSLIFCFGSNLAGRHGAGAAKFAKLHYDAKYGQGVGLQGKSYAIPTKDENLKTLPLNTINEYVKEFLKFAKQHPNLRFGVTNIGTGLAGYKHEQIAPFFKNYPNNVILTEDFKKVLEKYND